MNRTIYDSGVSDGTFAEVSTKTPNFFALKKAGVVLPIKPYSWTRFDRTDPYKSTYAGLKRQRDAAAHRKLVSSVQQGYLEPPAGAGRVSVQSLDNLRFQVTNRLLSKVRDQDIDLGVALGEYRETAAFFYQTCVRVSSAYRAMRRGNVSWALQILTGRNNDKWRDVPGVAANAWLAWSYGLSPLLNDVEGAVKALDKRNKYVDVYRVRSRKEHSLEEVCRWNQYTSFIKGHIVTRGEICFRVANPLYRAFDQLGLTNPLSVAWELVPFSFVVDWFLPVGKALAGIVPPQGVDFVSGWTTQKVSGMSKSSTAIASPSPGWYTTSIAEEVYKNRSVLSSFPSYHVVVPDLSLSKEKIASGLALLWSTSKYG